MLAVRPQNRFPKITLRDGGLTLFSVQRAAWLRVITLYSVQFCCSGVTGTIAARMGGVAGWEVEFVIH